MITENISLGHEHISLTSNGFLFLIRKVVHVSEENFENMFKVSKENIFFKGQQEKNNQ